MSKDATSVGQIGLDLVLNKKKFNKQMSGLEGVAKRSGAKIGAAIAAGLSVKAFASFTKSCLDLGSDLTEVQNVVDTAFPKISSRLDSFAKNAASSFGLSETMAKKYAGTFGAMSKSFGFAEKEAYTMSTALTGLAGDIASFYNISQDEAYTKLKSVFTGETETLKDLGVVMTQANLDQYALANGFGKTTSAMTEQEKVALRYQFVMSQLSLAQGDFAKTSGSWANQVRILTLQFESFKAAIGQGLINILTPVIQTINALMGRLVALANTFKRFTEVLTGKKSQNTGLSNATNDVDKLTSSADNAAGSVGNIGKTADKTASKLKRALFGFDQINKVDVKDTSTGATGGASGGGSASIDTGLNAALDDQNKKADALGKGYKKLRRSLEHLKESFNGFTAVLKSGGKWMFDSILKPLGEWTMQKLAPKLVEALASAFDLLTVALKAAAPVFKTIWDVLGKPLAKLAGSAIEKFLEILAKAFAGLAKAIEKHPKLFQAFVTALLGLMAVKKVTGILNPFRVALKNSGGTASGFATALGDVMKAAGKFVKVGAFLTKVTGPIDKVRVKFANWGGIPKGLTKLTGAFSKLKAAGGVLLGALKSVGKFFITNPIAIGIMAAVAAGILLYKNWDKIKKYAKKVGQAISKAFKPIADFFKKAWKNAIEKGSEVVEDMRNRIKGVVDGIKTYFGGWIDFITGVFTGNWKKAWEGVKGIFSGIWKTIKSALKLPDVEVKISAWFSDKKEALKEKWANLTADVKEKTAEMKAAVKQKWEDLKSRWEGITNNIKDKAAEFTADIKSSIEDIKAKWKARADNWKDKAADFKIAFNKTTSDIKSKIKALKAQWTGKTATFALKFSAAVSDLKKWVNTNVISKINAKFKKVPILKNHLIPKLAEGGYVKKNTPQLAMIGDNRHQGEVVAPEDKLLQMAKMAAAMSGGGTSPEVINLLKAILAAIEALELEVYLDGKPIKKRVVDLINANTKATGVCEIIV